MSDWIPSSRATVRICTVLCKAHAEERIILSMVDAMRCRNTITRSHVSWLTRRRLGQLWRQHDGWALAEAAGQTERLPDEVREELTA